MNRIPRPIRRALESLASSPINASALAMVEGKDFAHDSLYRALQQPLALYFTLALELCYQKGGLQRGYLIVDDVLIPRYSAGHRRDLPRVAAGAGLGGAPTPHAGALAGASGFGHGGLWVG